MILRALGSDDLIAWRAFRLQALRDHPEAFLTTLAEEQARTDDQVRTRLAGGTLHGLFDGDDLVGALSIDPMKGAAVQHRTWVNAVYVRSEDQGKGVAQQLMNYAVDQAHSQGALQLELYVSAANDRAIRFYERFGFEKAGKIPRAVMRDGVFEDDLHYVLVLEE